ncbi:TIGR00180 family glycosyltransferase [Roseospira visakhapatnamensis]|uniref:Glycosyltransferase domain-containing protein n=1 Tax=Roseospira visakhapatnamensis TaxID=390880 RepID=A0A7W6W9V3_9PROT|nr:TIGR00180 family glycosyltransferase [Roseospira visakhapatnamensis]MBB4266193.1 glycosyltransferase domain-containing protein [Roseospira visakhapatnamensis]
MSDDRVTVLIPTLNRAEFVVRALAFYARGGFAGRIILGDSSTAPHAQLVQAAVERFADRLTIHLEPLPKDRYPTLAECVQRMVDLVETPYMVMVPDDDLHMPGSLREAPDFLDAHPDYVGAMGERLNVKLGAVVPWGRVTWAILTKYADFEDPDPVKRLAYYTGYGLSLYYAVMRSDTWRACLEASKTLNLPYFGEEFLPNCLAVIRGRFRMMPRFGPIAQLDDSGGVWRRNTPYGLLNDPGWPAFRDGLLERLGQELVAQSDLPLAEARAIIDREIWRNLTILIPYHFQKSHDPAFAPDPLPDMKGLLAPFPDYQDVTAFLDAPVAPPITRVAVESALTERGDGIEAGAEARVLADACAGQAQDAMMDDRIGEAILWYRMSLAMAPTPVARMMLSKLLSDSGRTEEFQAMMTSAP